MGNHEYCVDCGESNFHYNRPCDPYKLAAMQAERAAQAKHKENGLYKLRLIQLALVNLGVASEIDTLDRLLIRYYDLPTDIGGRLFAAGILRDADESAVGTPLTL